MEIEDDDDPSRCVHLIEYDPAGGEFVGRLTLAPHVQNISPAAGPVLALIADVVEADNTIRCVDETRKTRPISLSTFANMPGRRPLPMMTRRSS